MLSGLGQALDPPGCDPDDLAGAEVASLFQQAALTSGQVGVIAQNQRAEALAFLELAVDAVSPRPEWVVEFEGRSGKVTMRLAGQDSVAIAALAEALSRTEP